jgi:hypothetical protein
LIAAIAATIAATEVAADTEIPGSSTAIRESVRMASADAATGIIDWLRSGDDLEDLVDTEFLDDFDSAQQARDTAAANIRTIALVQLANDEDGEFNAIFEEAMTEACRLRGFRLVTRADPTWDKLTEEWAFAEGKSDVMPVIPNFENVYPAGAIGWGRVRFARIDDSQLMAEASIEVRVGIPDSGVVGTIIGEGTAPIQAQTAVTAMVVELSRAWWFWPVAGLGGILGLIGCGMIAAVRKQARLAAKPLQAGPDA